MSDRGIARNPKGQELQPRTAAKALLGSSQEISRIILVSPGLLIAFLSYSEAENVVLLLLAGIYSDTILL